MSTESLLEQLCADISWIKARLNTSAMEVSPQTWFTTSEVAEQLKRSSFTVREWSRLGRINAEKRAVGRGCALEWMICADEVKRIREFGLLPRARHDV